MTFDRAAIMNHAWAMVRSAGLTGLSLRLQLSMALRTAWTAAKTARHYATIRSTYQRNRP
jgi:hypothetical protein